ncbi:porin [Empedobacter tilapiae]|uniref:Porin n=1 Tax=Empedobacter tilapiae TaxID=2491114 RepID=A0A4Z1BNS4_9FLAO|nr:porin [Empedobacter tilapiae]
MVKAQQSNDTIDISIRPYTSLRGHLAVHDKVMELQENASRAGLEINLKKGRIAFVAGVELQINMFKGNSSFNVDGNLDSDLLTIVSEQKQQVFGNRLGYLGIDLSKYGKITFGKQWSVYRDVTAYTDRFNVFGGRASATFTGGTDGGLLGTGRADQSIIYRNKIKAFQFGAQIQSKGGNDDKIIDGFGFSAQLELNQNISIGAAFNRAFIAQNLIDDNHILGLSGHPTFYSIGSKYTSKQFDFSLLGILQQNGDFTPISYQSENMINPSYVFDAKGFEIVLKYKLNKFSVLGGYNLYVPEAKKSVENIIIDKNFRRSDLITGLEYYPMKYVQLYTEQRISFGKNYAGRKEQNVFTLGMKLDLSKQFNTKLKL